MSELTFDGRFRTENDIGDRTIGARITLRLASLTRIVSD